MPPKSKPRPSKPKKIHHPPARSSPSSASTSNSTPSPTDTQILSILLTSLSSTTSDPSRLHELIQRIKSLLYEKKFLEVFDADANSAGDGDGQEKGGFGAEELLDAYAVRWVPGRALGFRGMFEELDEVVDLLKGRGRGRGMGGGGSGKGKEREVAASDGVDGLTQALESASVDAPPAATISSPSTARSKSKIISLGGGAGSELLALAALRQILSPSPPSSTTTATPPAPTPTSRQTAYLTRELPDWEIELIDIGDYGRLVGKLERGCRGVFTVLRGKGMGSALDGVEGLDAAASGSNLERDAGSDDLAGFKVAFHRLDILAPPTSPPHPDPLSLLLSPTPPTPNSPPESPPLITLLYTLTELFLQSRPLTIHLLRRLTQYSPRGTLFLVVDSANEEASSLGLGVEGRRWDLRGVVDGLMAGGMLLPDGNERERDEVDAQAVGGTAGERQQAEGSRPTATTKAKSAWTLVHKEDSKWYRFPSALQEGYPVKLENMRYWLRLYRRE